MNEVPENERDDRFTEELLRRTLGPRLTPEILQEVRQAECALVDRKDNLADLLDCGALTEEEFADKLNRVTSLYLRTVAGIVGEDACRAMYDFGPNDEIQVVEPGRLEGPMRPQIAPALLAELVTREWMIAKEGVSVKRDRDEFEDDLVKLVKRIAQKGEWEIAAGASPKSVGCRIAAALAVFLASDLTGPRTADLVWRVCEKILIFHDLLLNPEFLPDELHAKCGAPDVTDEDIGGYLAKYADPPPRKPR